MNMMTSLVLLLSEKLNEDLRYLWYDRRSWPGPESDRHRIVIDDQIQIINEEDNHEEGGDCIRRQ